MEGRFGLVVVAVDEYVGMPALPSTATAARLAELLRPYGGDEATAAEASTAPAVRKFLSGWSKAEGGPTSSLVYWVGHGESDGLNEWLLASDSTRPYTVGDAVPAAELAGNLLTRWATRVEPDNDAWTVLVLDVCNAGVGTLNILSLLTKDADRTPRRLAILRVASGASTVGRFVDELAAALAATTENDDIKLRGLLDEVARRLGDPNQTNWLPYDVALVNPRRTKGVVSMNVDLLDDWRQLVSGLPVEVRSHFVDKAQSAEAGDLAWHFAGRHPEMRRLTAWLRDQPGGLLVVTGEPGAGKSALLGEVVTLADGRMAGVLAQAGLLDDRLDDERPPAGVLDVVVHLTGKTLGEVVTRVAAVLPAGTAGDVRSVLDGVAGLGRRVTVLADALDESQEPLAIAGTLLQPLAELPNVRVLVGTRRSLLEGPDLPDPQSHELLDALGVTIDDTVFLEREPAAMAEYARRRLTGRAGVEPGTVDDLAARMEGVNQPFLFVRLAINELLARAEVGAGVDLDRLLTGGHRDLFGLAVERLAQSSPAVVSLLRALAYAQGRGAPRADRVWATMAEALDAPRNVADTQVDEALKQAAAYLTLDGEAGQSVYRLAHRTFAEHFFSQRDDLPLAHARIAAGLRAAVPAWPLANPYVLLHLLEHAWWDAGQFEAVWTDPGYLREVLRRFGVDRLVERLEAARRRVPFREVEALAGAVRKARVALAREPEQLAGQLFSRLHAETGPELTRLVAGLGEIGPAGWLRVVSAPLTWKAALEANQDFPQQVRALAFGQLAGSKVLGVGSGTALHLWDPRAGAPDPRFLLNEGGPIVALGLGTRGGQPVAVLAARDGTVTLRDLRTNDVLLRLHRVSLSSVCLGRVAGREVVAGGTSSTVAWWDAWTGEPLGGRDLGEGYVATAVGPTEGGVVVAAMNWGTIEVAPVDGSATGDPWPHGLEDPRALGLAEVEGRVFVVAGDRQARVVCWEWLGRVADPVGVVGVGFPVRAVAVTRTEEATVVAAADDQDGPYGYVALRDPQSLAGDRMLSPRWPVRPVGVARSERGLVAVCDETPLRLRSVPDGGIVAGEPSAEEVARVLGPGGRAGLRFSDVGPGGATLRTRPQSRAVPKKASQTTYRRAAPASWPVTASTYGLVGGRAVQVTGSYAGAVWIWDLKARKLLAGPFGDVPESLAGHRVHAKPGVPAVRSLSLCNAGGEDYVGAVCDGTVRVWHVATGRPAVMPEVGHSSAVALGELDGRLLMARGSDSGTVRLFDLTRGERLAALTLDERIEDVWLVPGERTVAVMTGSFEVLVLTW